MFSKKHFYSTKFTEAICHTIQHFSFMKAVFYERKTLWLHGSNKFIFFAMLKPFWLIFCFFYTGLESLTHIWKSYHHTIVCNKHNNECSFIVLHKPALNWFRHGGGSQVFVKKYLSQLREQDKNCFFKFHKT